MTPNQLRQIIRGELQTTDNKVEGSEAAILIVADHLPGSVPGEKSYVRKRIERAFSEPSDD